jgi:hypothetical protein
MTVGVFNATGSGAQLRRPGVVCAGVRFGVGCPVVLPAAEAVGEAVFGAAVPAYPKETLIAGQHAARIRAMTVTTMAISEGRGRSPAPSGPTFSGARCRRLSSAP